MDFEFGGLKYGDSLSVNRFAIVRYRENVNFNKLSPIPH